MFAAILALLFTVSSLMLFPLDARAQRIENNVRIKVGMYLGQSAGFDQSLVSESSGYVGYYSNAQLYDYPGLTSPLSYHTLADAPPQDRSLLYLIYRLQPDWVVLRPVERKALAERYPDIYARYTTARIFTTDPRLNNWGITEDTIDATFYVLRRQ